MFICRADHRDPMIAKAMRFVAYVHATALSTVKGINSAFQLFVFGLVSEQKRRESLDWSEHLFEKCWSRCTWV